MAMVKLNKEINKERVLSHLYPFVIYRKQGKKITFLPSSTPPQARAYRLYIPSISQIYLAHDLSRLGEGKIQSRL